MASIFKRSGIWYVIVDADRQESGKRRQKWHKVEGDYNEATKLKAKLEVSVHEKRYVEPKKLTLGEHLNQWIREYPVIAQLSGSTTQRYKEIIDTHIIPALGRKRLDKLTTADIRSFLATCLSCGRKDGRPGGLSAQTVIHIRRVLRLTLKQAVSDKLIASNPTDDTRSPKVARTVHPTLTAEEMVRFRNAAKTSKNYMAVLLALHTGMRRGEILGLKWRDVDFDLACLSVRETYQKLREAGDTFKRPKSDSGMRTITLEDALLRELKNHREWQIKARRQIGMRPSDNDLVIAELDGSPVSPMAVTKALIPILKRAGLPPMNLHGLRHAHASLLAHLGVPPKVTQERLGHSRIELTLGIYTHVLPGGHREAANKFHAALTGASPEDSREVET
jgi:integrase